MGQRQPGERHAVPDQARALHQLRRRRTRRRKGASPTRCSGTPRDPYHYLRLEPHRDHDFVIFGGEDHKTGQAADTDGVLTTGWSARWPPLVAGRRDHASLVGPGDRDAGRAAVHRRDRRAPVRGDRILRQRHDVRHARRHDGVRSVLGRENPGRDLFDPGAQEASRRPVGLPQARTRTIRIT